MKVPTFNRHIMTFEQRIVYQSVIFMKDTHYVYKFTIIPTGHFYIGMTDSLERRLRQHENELDSAISSRRIHGDTFEFSLKLYEVGSKVLYMEKSERILAQGKHVRDNTKIEAIGLVSGRESAKALEKHLIIEHSGNELLLNTRYANF